MTSISYIIGMKVVKSRAFKDRLKGHKESVISLFSPYGSDGHMLYSISKDGSVRGNPAKMQVGTSPKEKSPSRHCWTRRPRLRRKKKKRQFLMVRARKKRKKRSRRDSFEKN